MKTKPLEQKIEEILAYYESDGSNITMPKTVEAISNLVEEEVKKALESVRDTFNLDTSGKEAPKRISYDIPLTHKAIKEISELLLECKPEEEVVEDLKGQIDYGYMQGWNACRDDYEKNIKARLQ